MVSVPRRPLELLERNQRSHPVLNQEGARIPDLAAEATARIGEGGVELVQLPINRGDMGFGFVDFLRSKRSHFSTPINALNGVGAAVGGH